MTSSVDDFRVPGHNQFRCQTEARCNLLARLRLGRLTLLNQIFLMRNGNRRQFVRRHQRTNLERI